LNTDYVGDAVIVRRSSDNATQSIGFVDGELDVDTLNTFCSGTDGFITTWYDQSGNGNDATQSIASEQPKIYDSTTGVILENNKPAIYTDGVDGFVISSVIAATGQKYAFSVNTVDDALWSMYADDAAGGNIIPVGQSGSVSGISIGYTLNVLYHNTNVFSGTSGDLYTLYNTTGQSLTTIDFDGAGVGVLLYRNGFRLQGFTQEIIIYNSDQSSNRTGIETNINEFYSIY